MSTDFDTILKFKEKNVNSYVGLLVLKLNNI
jgi:hypothetical protein